MLLVPDININTRLVMCKLVPDMNVHNHILMH